MFKLFFSEDFGILTFIFESVPITRFAVNIEIIDINIKLKSKLLKEFGSKIIIAT